MINHIITGLDYLERLALALVSRITPWAAPLAPAYLVARTVQRHFGAPVWVAVAVAITVEAVGIASTHITMEMWEWNQTRNKSLPAARFGVGMACVVIYFATGIFLTVALELAPALVAYAPASLFILAAVAYVTLVLMSSLARLREAAGEAKAERRAARKPTGQVSGQISGHKYSVRRWANKKAFMADFNRPDDLTTRQIMELAGVDDRTARRWRAAARSGNGGGKR